MEYPEKVEAGWFLLHLVTTVNRSLIRTAVKSSETNICVFGFSELPAVFVYLGKGELIVRCARISRCILAVLVDKEDNKSDQLT